jgi:hypothetical protein
MKRLLAAAAIAASLGLAGQARADMAEADALYGSDQYEQAFAAYAELAKDENGEAMLRLAQMFEAGEGIGASYARALTWYRRAAAHDVAAAHFRIGEMYETGIGVPRNYGAAVRAYRAAADLGHVDAMIRLANLYTDGSGAMPDASEAARLLKQAADSGDAEAVAALDHLVASGTVPRNVLDDLGIPPPPPPALPTVEELAAEGIAAQDDGAAVQDLDTDADMVLEDEAASAGETAADATVAVEESEDAARVRAAITTAVTGFIGGEDATVDYRIDIAEDAGGAMVATVRGMRMLSSEGTWEIGDLVYTLSPVAESTYDVVLTLPATTSFFDAAGKASGGTSIGSQDLRGTWNLALNLWTDGIADLRALDLQMTPPGKESFAMTIAAITGESRLGSLSEGKWGGVSRLAIEGIAFAGDHGELGAIARIDAMTDQRAVDYIFFQAMSLARAEFEQRFGAQPDLGDPEVQEVLQGLTQPLFALARERAPLIGDVGMEITLSGISGTDPDSGAPLAIARVHFGISARDLDGPSGMVNIAYKHEGLATVVDGVMQRYLPADMAFVVALRNLPVEDAATMTLEMFESGLTDPASFEENAMMALTLMGLGLQQSMAQAGSSLEIEHVAYVSEALKAHMSGTLVATTASPLGATGTVTLEVEELDAAVAELSARQDDPDAQEAAMPLAMLQAMGQRIEDGGAVRHVYVVELTPDGRTLLNGNDMGPMMDGMMGGGESMAQ